MINLIVVIIIDCLQSIFRIACKY